MILKFTSQFFSARIDSSRSHGEWFRKAAYVLANYKQLPGEIISDEVDRRHVRALIDLIVLENRNHKARSVALIQSIMTSILELLLRNVRRGPFHELDGATGYDERLH